MNRLLLVATVVTPLGTAHAEPDAAQGEVLFKEGLKLMDSGRTAEACAAFDASQKLDPNTATLLNQAACREANGQLATAWGLFVAAERRTRAPAEAKLHDVAAGHTRSLEPRLSTLAIVVASDAVVGGLEVSRDGVAVEAGAWNKALPIDGGTYTIVAHAPGNAAWSTTVTIAVERDAKSVEVPRLHAAELRPQPAAPSPHPVVEAHAVTHADRRSHAGLVAGGVAVVTLGGALALELAGRATYDRAVAAADPATQTSLWQRANHERYAAEGLALAGVAAGGVALWLSLRGHGSERLAIAPAIGGGAVGLVIGGVR